MTGNGPEAKQGLCAKERMLASSGANHAVEKKCWMADELSLTPQCHSAPGLGSVETLIPRAEESSEEDRQFPPTFLLLEIIFAHSPYGRVFLNLPILHGNLLCRPDWLPLRRIVGDRMRDPPGSRVRCLSHGSAPRCVGPCRPQRFSTNSGGIQIQCLGLGAWAEQTSPVPCTRTVSTTQIRITGNCVGMRRQNGTDRGAPTKEPPCRAKLQRTLHQI